MTKNSIRAKAARKLLVVIGLAAGLGCLASTAKAQSPPNPGQAQRPRQFAAQQPKRVPQFGTSRQFTAPQTFNAQQPFSSQQQYQGQQQFNGQQQYQGQKPFNGQQQYQGRPQFNGQQQYQGQPQFNSQRGQAGQFNRPQGRVSQSGDPRNGGPTYGGPLHNNQRGGNPAFKDPAASRFANSQAAGAQGPQFGPVQKQHTMEINDDNFQTEVLNSTTPVLVDIWAPWCGPCKAIGPMIDEVAQENAGSLKVGKLNLDECPEVAKAFDIQGLPTLLIFQNGELVDSILGAPEKEKLQAALDAVER